MKRLFGILIVFLLPTFGLTQAPTVIWDESFTLGGTTDFVNNFCKDSQTGFLYVAGSKTTQDADSVAVSRFTPEGKKLWTIALDSSGNPWGPTGIVSIDRLNRIFVTTQDGFLAALDTTGKKLWIKKIGLGIKILPYNDSILAIVLYKNLRLQIYSKDGTLTRETPEFLSESNYVLSAQIWNGSVYFFGADRFGITFNSALLVARVDIASGTLHWKYHVPDHLAAYGAVDSLGNAYFAAGRMDSKDSLGFWKFHAVSVDSSGASRWETWWYAHTSPLANWESYVECAALSPFLRGQQFIIGGLVDKSEVDHTAGRKSYLAGLDSHTGNILWTKEWEHTQGELSSYLTGTDFTPQGELIAQGRSFSALDGSIPMIGFLTKFSLPGVTLGVKELPDILPHGFSLSQNYPNPFNPTTQIRFSVPHASHVKLTVVNTLGQEVVVLVDKEMSSGTYEATFDGAQCASGAYFYRLTAGASTETHKMLLVR